MADPTDAEINQAIQALVSTLNTFLVEAARIGLGVEMDVYDGRRGEVLGGGRHDTVTQLKVRLSRPL